MSTNERPPRLTNASGMATPLQAILYPLLLALGLLGVGAPAAGAEYSVQVVQIASGSGHNCALTETGRVYCWGRNDVGQLGDGTTHERRTPVIVGALPASITAIVAGARHTCALTETGQAYCWGDNQVGQLGNGGGRRQLLPVAVKQDGDRYSSLAAGSHFTCGITYDKYLMCWGDNDRRQLGTNQSVLQTLTPSKSVNLAKVHSVTAGDKHVCASLLFDGSVVCWGGNGLNQLNNGTHRTSPFPVPISQVDGPSLVGMSAGANFTCAVHRKHAVTCWGEALRGDLRQPVNAEENWSPDFSSFSEGFTTVAAGKEHACGLSLNDEVICWGRNSEGQTGQSVLKTNSEPARVNKLAANIDSISTGDQHTCVSSTTAGIYCWGSNAFGQLGDGKKTSSSAPRHVTIEGASSNSGTSSWWPLGRTDSSRRNLILSTTALTAYLLALVYARRVLILGPIREVLNAEYRNVTEAPASADATHSPTGKKPTPTGNTPSPPDDRFPPLGRSLVSDAYLYPVLFAVYETRIQRATRDLGRDVPPSAVAAVYANQLPDSYAWLRDELKKPLQDQDLKYLTKRAIRIVEELGREQDRLALKMARKVFWVCVVLSGFVFLLINTIGRPGPILIGVAGGFLSRLLHIFRQRDDSISKRHEIEWNTLFLSALVGGLAGFAGVLAIDSMNAWGVAGKSFEGVSWRDGRMNTETAFAAFLFGFSEKLIDRAIKLGENNFGQAFTKKNKADPAGGKASQNEGSPSPVPVWGFARLGVALPREDGSPPDGFPVKAILAFGGIYHTPRCVNYATTIPDICFDTAERAEQASFRHGDK